MPSPLALTRNPVQGRTDRLYLKALSVGLYIQIDSVGGAFRYVFHTDEEAEDNATITSLSSHFVHTSIGVRMAEEWLDGYIAGYARRNR